MKTALITYHKKLTWDLIKDCKRKLFYDKYFIYTQKIDFPIDKLKENKKFEIIECSYGDISSNLETLITKHKNNYKFHPFFRGDVNSKFSIKVYNLVYGKKINPNAFRIKNRMNSFLGTDIVNKKSLKYSYDEIQEMNYAQLKKKVGTPFILKPINAASSLLNFKVSDNKDFQKVKKTIRRKYQYVVEEYLEGNLYSIDFFCDGKDTYLVCFAREIPFLELLEKFSEDYLEKYQKQLKAEFLHFLPIRYTLNLKKMTPLEVDFVKKIGDKLIEKGYRGFIHLEYKVKRKEGKIGFIEWGARTGAKRAEFVEGMHGVRLENLPLEIIEKNDKGRFRKSRGVYFLKDKDIDKNYLMIKTSVTQKTHIMSLLSKIPSYLNVSYEDFLKSYLWDKWKVKIKSVSFFWATNTEGYIFPFYERSDTRFNYIMEFEEESFKKVLKNKHSILEHLVFHDYE